MSEARPERTPFLARVVDLFLRADLALLLVAVSLVAGVLAVTVTPREEEPQIVVPMADVLVQAPGLAPEEVERQVATPLEKLLTQIAGVEHVYSQSLPGRAVVSVRFFVGEDREDSLVAIYDKIFSHTDVVPPDVGSWVVKPVEIDDVPIVIVTLWSERPEAVDDFALRRIAEELEILLQAVPETNRTEVVGGRPRVVRVELDPDALAARQTSALDVAWALGVSNARRSAGRFDRGDRDFLVEAGEFFADARELRRAVVNVVDGRPVFLEDVAVVRDGPAERTAYTSIAFGPAAGGSAPAGDGGAPDGRAGIFLPAVHVSVAKQRGANAVDVAERVRARVEALEATLLPEGVHARVTRDHGATADRKVDELLEALAVAVVVVIGLIAWTLGWREGLVVAVAVPITFSLTLLVNWATGYTINRVTLFALILALGLVVDDPIVDVENIYRHLRLGREEPRAAVRTAVNEVRPPILLATLAVIVSFLPMNFITGMMGPYMRPMALNVPVAMAMSMLVAFTVTPWLAWRVLRKRAAAAPEEDESEGAPPALRRAYAGLLAPFLDDRRLATALLVGVALLFAGAASLAALRAVPLKMLPFDNKDELQIVVDPPEGTTLERTDAVARELAEVLRRAPEVRDVSLYSGLASPMDFNGMVRHYYLREGPHVADLRVNLAPKRRRAQQSHALALRLRDDLEAVARRAGARIAVVETPPGPPVLATLTAEVTAEPGTPYERVREAARAVAARLEVEPGVADVDTTVEDEAERRVFVVDKVKAALSGVATEDVARTLELALAGLDATRLHQPDEANPLPIRLRLARDARSGEERLLGLAVKGRPGIVKVREDGGVRDAPAPIVRLGEIGGFVARPREKAIVRKDLRRVAWVTAEPVGRAPAEVAADLAADLQRGSDGHETSRPPPPPPPQAAEGGAQRAAGERSPVGPAEGGAQRAAGERSPVGPAEGGAQRAAGERSPIALARRTYLSSGGGIPWTLPEGTSVSWLAEGELDITVDVFRDLGIAFGVALLGIYGILVFQTRSYAMPLILMISIPLTLIGILPGFWLLNAVGADTVGGHRDAVFFTATAMIGMIALAGIAVRNAILLIEFVHMALARGVPLRDALLGAGAVRTRPIFLTAGTALLAAVPITLDPIFSGLAWALIFGLLVSTAFTLVVVPVVYDLVYRDRPGHGLPAGAGGGAA